MFIGPIYEEVNKQPTNCDTEALQRLSQLLTTPEGAPLPTSEVAPLIEGATAPMASQEVSSLGTGTSAENVFQELDEAFNTLDQELEHDTKENGLIVSAPTAI